MSNVETAPAEVVCGGDPPGVEVVDPRAVPLGGPRAMTVRRTLPRRARSLIGAWCFVDHYGPDRVADTGGMAVPGHPHTGLQTVSWLFTGEVEHRDTTGVLVDTGAVTVAATAAAAGQLVYLPPGAATLDLHSDDGARVLLLGGEPLGERLVMWWNFIGGDHDEIVEARARWQHERADPGERDRRFGALPAEWSSTLPAPELPNARLRPRD